MISAIHHMAPQVTLRAARQGHLYKKKHEINIRNKKLQFKDTGLRACKKKKKENHFPFQTDSTA